MHVTFDPEANAAYVYLDRPDQDGRSIENVVVERKGKGDVVLDFDSNGFLMGVGIIGAAELLSQSVRATAEQI